MSFFCINCKTSTTATYKACPYCGEPITDFLRLHLEHPIDGKYKILSRLGVGGMGEVYKVLHVHLNAIRVVKLMRPNLSAESDSNERFIREARLATRIHHPNVATLYDFSTLPDGSHYMVWEYIEGVNLADLLRARGFLSPRYACQLAVPALQGLEAIHRAGIVHRDISPENLMITRNEDGEEIVKIIDLGIAKQSADDQDDQTKTGIFVGKWKYCSPEQLGLLKPGERIDARADLYSFGIVLYEMLAGRPPFLADSPQQYFVLHSNERPATFKAANPDAEIPDALEALLLRALDKAREKRFASARAFAAALTATMPHLPETAAGAVAGDAAQLPRRDTLPSPVRSGDDETVSTGAAAVASTEITRSEADIEAQTKRSAGSPDFADTVGTAVGTAPLTAAGTAPDLIPISDRTLIQGLDESRPAGVRRDSRLLVVAASAAALVVVIGWLGVAMWRKPTVVPARPSVAATTPAPAGNAQIALNAFPWGEIKEITEVGSGRVVPVAGVVTPATLELAAGTYRLVVEHPAYGEKTEIVELEAGGLREVNLQLTSPDSLKVPSFIEVKR